MSVTSSAWTAVMVGAALITIFYLFQVLFYGSRRWFLFKKKFNCHVRKVHEPDTPSAAVGGRQVQRCLYCDHIIREYTVSIDSVRRTR